jgi:hypothetical protein
VEQELLTLPEDQSSPPVFGGVHALILCVIFMDHCLFFLPLCCLSFLDLWILDYPFKLFYDFPIVFLVFHFISHGTLFNYLNKRWRKLKGQSRMNNPSRDTCNIGHKDREERQTKHF